MKTDWGGGSAQAVFMLAVDDTTADNDVVAIIDINDATTDEVLASRALRRREFRTPQAAERFAVDADLSGRSGHAMETRVWWKDISYLRVDSLSVSTSEL
jgi:hypothetical protein